MKIELPDGLYRVVGPNLCAGFEIEDGRLKACAPILGKRILYWVGYAELVAGSDRGGRSALRRFEEGFDIEGG